MEKRKNFSEILQLLEEKKGLTLMYKIDNCFHAIATKKLQWTIDFFNEGERYLGSLLLKHSAMTTIQANTNNPELLFGKELKDGAFDVICENVSCDEAPGKKITMIFTSHGKATEGPCKITN